MSIRVNRELDPIYETIKLLYNGYDIEKYRKSIIEELNHVGKNGEELYQKHFLILDKYYDAFQKNRITSDRDAFYFKDISTDFFISFIAPILIDKSFIHSVHQMDNDQILKIILQKSDEIFERDLTGYLELSHADFIKTEHITTFINTFDLNDNEKWKMLLFLQNPQDYYKNVCDLIKKNIAAFEKAVKVVKPTYDKYMEQYNCTYTTEEKAFEFLNKFNLANCDIHEVNPSLASAMGLIIFTNVCYIGLLMDITMTEIGFEKSGKEYLLNCLKALSDQSKMKIIISLKDSPKYATELASQLGLTSATVSHHMNTLVAIHLVYVEKENGKYYYHVNADTITEILEQLKSLLL